MAVNVVRSTYINPVECQGRNLEGALEVIARTDFGDFRAGIKHGSYYVLVNGKQPDPEYILKDGDRIDILVTGENPPTSS